MVGFQPDWLWIKRRSATNSHHIVDAVRGAGYALASDLTNAQYSSSVSSFDSDGFTVTGSVAAANASSSTYAWNWRAGGGQGSSNTDGSTNTTYTSVNTTRGFSISTYTGTGSAAIIGHGLGVAPKMILIKRTSDSDSWTVGHDSLGWGKYLRLDTTEREASNTSTWNNTAPTSTVFSVNHADTNDNNRTFVAIASQKKLVTNKFGSYTGNGNADGTFIYTGFKPAFVLGKRADTGTEDWYLFDTTRDDRKCSYLDYFISMDLMLNIQVFKAG